MAREDMRVDEFADLGLARRLGAAAGSLPDANMALSSLRTRVVTAHRRRTRWAVAAFVVGMVSVGSVLAIQTRRSMTMSPSDPAPIGSAVPVATTAPTTSTTVAPSTTAATTVPPTVDDTTVPPGAIESTPPPSAPTAEPPAAPPSGEPAADDDDQRATAGTGSATPQAADTSAAQTITSEGGSIGVDMRDHRLTLTDVQAADGRHVARQEVDPDRIVVTFASSDRVSTITIEVIEGRVHADVREGDRGDGRDGRGDGDGRNGDGGHDGRGDGSSGRGDGRTGDGSGDSRDGGSGDRGGSGDGHDGGWSGRSGDWHD